MQKPKLIRITTVPISLEKLLEGQLGFMSQHYEVVAISAEKERLAAYGKQEGVRIFHVPLTRKITPLRDLRAVYKLYRFLTKEKPLIVHSHTPKAGIVGMLAAYLSGVPNRFHTVAGLPLMEARGVKRFLLNGVEKLTYRLATMVYPNSKGLYDFIVSERFTAPSKLKIIANGSSNGIDTHFFSEAHFSEAQHKAKKLELGIHEGDFVFIFVGRVVKDKGINELISAFRCLNKKHPNSKLVLVGPLENDLDPISKDATREIDTNPNIINTGFQQDVRPYFAISNALVFPSYREGFPNVVLQAGSMGLPGLVSDINGCNEIIEDRKNGLIFPPKNEERLLASMELLVSDKGLCEQLGSVAREMITSQFERSEVWNALLEEYPGS